MLDAGAAVRTALGTRVVVGVSPAAPVAGQALTLSASGSTVAAGRSIVAWQWSLVDGGGAIGALSGTAVSLSVTPGAAGTFTVRLVITDDQGVSVATQHSVTVAGAPVLPPAPPVPPPTPAGGGGGAMAWAWLLALLAAAGALAGSRPRRC